MDVSKVVGISESALVAYEAGEKLPRDEIKKRLADFYGLPIGDLFPPSRKAITHLQAPEFLLAVDAWERTATFSEAQKAGFIHILSVLLQPGGADRVMLGTCSIEK